MTLEKWLEQLPSRISAWKDTVRTDPLNPGLFKMSRHAFHPFSLDASSLGLDLCYMLGQSFAANERHQIVAKLNSFQQTESGFYQEPFSTELDRSIPRVDEMSATYLSFQICGALESLEALPDRPFGFYRFLLKKGAVTEYLESKFPWSRAPWGAGGWVDSLATLLRTNIRMGAEEYQLPYQELLIWLAKNQNPDTGLWGDPNSPQGLVGLVNGGYHILRGTYFQEKIPLRYPERIIDSCLTVFAGHFFFRAGQGEGCHDLDLFDLLLQCHLFTPSYRKSEIETTVQSRLTQIREFQNEDGGFSFFPHKAQTEHNYYRVTPGMVESDLQGSVFYLHVIKRMTEFLGLEFPVKRSKTHGYE